MSRILGEFPGAAFVFIAEMAPIRGQTASSYLLRILCTPGEYLIISLT